MDDQEKDHVVMLGFPKRKRRKLLLVGVAVTLACLLSAVLYFIVLNDDYEGAIITGTLMFSAKEVHYSHFVVVKVVVQGWIINSGSGPSAASVSLDVYDGYIWHKYLVITEVIPKNGGMFWFQWSNDYDNAIEDIVDVQYIISAA